MMRKNTRCSVAMLMGLMFIVASFHYFTKEANLDIRFHVVQENGAKTISASERFPAVNFSLQVEDVEWNKIKCVPFQVHGDIPTPICIFDTDEDFLSKLLARGRMWQQNMITEMENVLLSDPELHLIDLGANLGTWTLTAARLGRKVLAVEMFPPTISRLIKSLKLGQLQDLVTLVPQPLSDIHENISIYLCAGNNKMAANIVKDAKVMPACGEETPFVASTITMDDLSDYLPNGFKRALMKIDIEEMELRVFNRSENFLTTVDVPIIVMEWIHHVRYIGTPKVSFFVSYMNRMGYVPLMHLYGPDGRLGSPERDKNWSETSDLYLVKESYIQSKLAHLQMTN